MCVKLYNYFLNDAWSVCVAAVIYICRSIIIIIITAGSY